MLKENRTGTGEKRFAIHSYAYGQMMTDSFKEQFTDVMICSDSMHIILMLHA